MEMGKPESLRTFGCEILGIQGISRRRGAANGGGARRCGMGCTRRPHTVVGPLCSWGIRKLGVRRVGWDAVDLGGMANSGEGRRMAQWFALETRQMSRNSVANFEELTRTQCTPN